MIKKYFNLILIILMVLGGILRIVKLDAIPPHLGNDEISIAFDSYSIRNIGLDEHGHKWPLSFESHRSYKAPLYAYLNMPINWLIGNNEYGIRLTSAIFGILLILTIGILGRFLVGDFFGLMAAFLLMINPKAIFVSRIGYEANVAYAMMTLGVLFMFYFIQKHKNRYTWLAGIFLGLSIWGYHTQWGLTPMLALVFPWLVRKSINIKKWWPMWLMLFLLALPIFYDFVHTQRKDPNNRASSQIWFEDPYLKDYLKTTNDNLIKKGLMVAVGPVNNYLQHFNFDCLFTNGVGLFNQTSPLESGWFLLASLPLLLVGLFNFKKIFKENTNFVLGWWLLCPIVPALTYGGVSAVRNLAFLVPTILIMAGGFDFLRRNNWKLFWVFSLLIVINFIIFTFAYFVHYPLDSGNNFQYGYKQAWEYIKPEANSYQNIIVEPKFGRFGQYVGVPHLYFGYFQAFDVREMQNRIDGNGTKIGKFWFKEIDWNKEIIKENSIYVVSVINPTTKLQLIKTIETPDHQPQFLIYKN